jgi:hypothetical protein
MTTYVLVHGAWHATAKACMTALPLRSRRISKRTPVKADGIDDYHELRTGHDAMVTAWNRVAVLLSSVE